MSITSRINEMSSHIEQAYDELQGLGADLTNVDKNIENISMVLDDIYDSLPSVSDEGTSLTLDDTRVGKIKSTLKGNTSQDGTPTPSSPIPVNVVSGDNEIEVCGKNLFDKNNTNIFNGFTNTASNKLEANNNARTICFPCQSSTTYTISKTLSARFIVCETSSATISANIPTTTIEANPQALSITGTTKSDTKYLLIFYYLSTADTLTESQIRDSIQIEKRSTATTYEPYQGNTYNIDLPSGMELCKIGSYQDYFYKDSGKWYKYGMVGKVVLDGTQTITINSSSASRTVFEVNNITNLKDYATLEEQDDLPNILCSKFNQVSQNASWVSGNISKKRLNQNKVFIIWEANKTIAELEMLTTNMPIYYVLETPTNTEITYQPLIDQLNAIEKAMSKDGQTNISQVNNDLPFIISASALKEWSE